MRGAASARCVGSCTIGSAAISRVCNHHGRSCCATGCMITRCYRRSQRSSLVHIFTAYPLSPLQATLSKLLIYCLLKPTQPPTLSGMGMSSSLPIAGYGVKVVWLIGSSLLFCRSSCLLVWAMDGRIM